MRGSLALSHDSGVRNRCWCILDSGAATWLPPDLWSPEERSKVKNAAVKVPRLLCHRRPVGQAGRLQGHCHRCCCLETSGSAVQGGCRLLLRLLPHCHPQGPPSGEGAVGSIFLAARWCRGGKCWSAGCVCCSQSWAHRYFKSLIAI